MSEVRARYRPATSAKDSEPIEIQCCYIFPPSNSNPFKLSDNVQCPNDGEFDIITTRNGGMAGPDPYSDETFSCEEHVGVMLGHQPDAVRTEEIYWQVFRMEAVAS